MVVIVFAVAVLISMIDPLLILAYGAAGICASDWRRAALYGAAAGGGMLLLLAAISGGTWHPKAFNVLSQLCACGIGAALVRLVMARFRPAAAAPENSV